LEDNINIDLMKISYEDWWWMELAHDGFQWCTVALIVLKLPTLLPVCQLVVTD